MGRSTQVEEAERSAVEQQLLKAERTGPHPNHHFVRTGNGYIVLPYGQASEACTFVYMIALHALFPFSPLYVLDERVSAAVTRRAHPHTQQEHRKQCAARTHPAKLRDQKNVQCCPTQERQSLLEKLLPVRRDILDRLAAGEESVTPLAVPFAIWHSAA